MTSVAKNLTGIGDIVADVIPEVVFAEAVNTADSFSRCFESLNHDVVAKVKKTAVDKVGSCIGASVGHISEEQKQQAARELYPWGVKP